MSETQETSPGFSGSYNLIDDKVKVEQKGPKSSSSEKCSSGEEDDDGDDWQFYGKDFIEPGEDATYRSVR